MSAKRKRIIKLKPQNPTPQAMPQVLYPEVIEEEARRQEALRASVVRLAKSLGLEVVEPGNISPDSVDAPERVEVIRRTTNPRVRDAAAKQRAESKAIQTKPADQRIRAWAERWTKALKALNQTMKAAQPLVKAVSVVCKYVSWASGIFQ